MAKLDAVGKTVWLRPLVLDADQVASSVVPSGGGELHSMGRFGSLSREVAYGLALSDKGWVHLTGQCGGGPGIPDRPAYAWFLAALSSDGEQAWQHVATAE